MRLRYSSWQQGLSYLGSLGTEVLPPFFVFDARQMCRLWVFVFTFSKREDGIVMIINRARLCAVFGLLFSALRSQHIAQETVPGNFESRQMH